MYFIYVSMQFYQSPLMENLFDFLLMLLFIASARE